MVAGVAVEFTEPPYKGRVTGASHRAVCIPPKALRALHVMAKPTGAICNLDCSYCFYLEKQSLYPGGRFRMGLEVTEAYVRQLIEAHTGKSPRGAWS